MRDAVSRSDLAHTHTHTPSKWVELAAFSYNAFDYLEAKTELMILPSALFAYGHADIHSIVFFDCKPFIPYEN